MKTEYPIGHPRFGSIIRCPACGDGNLAQRLRETSQLSGWLLGASFQDFKVGTKNKDAYKAALNVAQEPRGWLTLWGGYGEGKTHLLAAAVNQATARRIGAAYFVLPDLLNTLRDSFSAGDQEEGYTARYSRLLDIPLLVIDEMDKARKTEWSLEALFTLTDARYRRRGSQGTIFATNMQPDVTDPVLGYLASRMFDRDSCQVISLNGGDYRRVER